MLASAQWREPRVRDRKSVGQSVGHMPWNRWPRHRGIRGHMRVEYSLGLAKRTIPSEVTVLRDTRDGPDCELTGQPDHVALAVAEMRRTRAGRLMLSTLNDVIRYDGAPMRSSPRSRRRSGAAEADHLGRSG